MLFSNRKIEAADPGIEDMAPTALDLFGIEPPPYMEGKSAAQAASRVRSIRRSRHEGGGWPSSRPRSSCTSACANHATRAAGKRMIVLGIDGMDPVFVETHFASLPNLNRLRQQGTFRRLATTIPPQSPVAWSSVITGMDPGGHGIFDFVHRNPSTRMPVSSMAETTEPTRSLAIGPYLIPLSGGGVRSLRAGRAFWQMLEEHGVRSTVIRMPANFPPAECEAESLAGMGTPDMTGLLRHVFVLHRRSGGEARQGAGRADRARRLAQRARGPRHPRSAQPDAPRPPGDLGRADRIRGSRGADRALRYTGARSSFSAQGEWSEWVQAEYSLIPHVNSVRGIFRVYLQQAHPYLRVYVSPVNIDPEDPALPISTPRDYSRQLAGAVGPFYTQGIAEETSAFRAGILSKAEFLVQSRKVLADSLRLFRYELDRFQDGLFFYYFSSVDQNSHMLWGRYDGDLLEIYRAVDQADRPGHRQSRNGHAAAGDFRPRLCALQPRRPSEFLPDARRISDPGRSGQNRRRGVVRSRGLEQDPGLRDRPERRLREPGRTRIRRRRAGSRQAAGAGPTGQAAGGVQGSRSPARRSSSACTSPKRRSAAGI